MTGAGEVRRYDVADRWLAASGGLVHRARPGPVARLRPGLAGASRPGAGPWARPVRRPSVADRCARSTCRARSWRSPSSAGCGPAAVTRMRTDRWSARGRWPSRPVTCSGSGRSRPARAETAWLHGPPERIAGARRRHLPRSPSTAGHAWAVGELGYWLWMAGAPRTRRVGAARPWALQIAGRRRRRPRAAGASSGARTRRRWRDRARTTSRTQLAALRELHAPRCVAGGGTVGAADARRRDPRLPRRPRRTTARHPARLTERQADVLELLSDGLRNTEIAARLHISPKTVDHHVSAVLAQARRRLRARRRPGGRGPTRPDPPTGVPAGPTWGVAPDSRRREPEQSPPRRTR